MTQCVSFRLKLLFFFGFIMLAASCGPNGPGGPTLTGVLPTQIGGANLELHTFEGAQIADLGNADWTKALDGIGATTADLSIALSVPALNATSDFQIGAIRIANTDWATRLADFAQSANAAGNVTFTQVTLGGKTVYRGTSNAAPTGAKSYYSVADDTLFFIVASNEAEATEALSKIPASSTMHSLATTASSASHLAGSIPPATGVLLVSTIIVPTNPFCVGELPNPNQKYVFLVADGNMVPDAMAFTTPQTTFGKAYPPVALGALPSFVYNATSYAAGSGQHIVVNVISTVHGDSARVDITPPQLIVQQCLNGTNWIDGDRHVTLVQSGSTFSGGQTSGTATCQSPGYTLSGSFTMGAVAQIAGSTLQLCNPKVCVDAGLMSLTSTATFQGSLSDDGKVLSITWDDPVVTLTHDQDGNLISCVPTSSVSSQFALSRSFAEPWRP